jgi:hypothetical protein
MSNVKTGKPSRTRRTPPPMTVRVVHVEPPDAARAAMARTWTLLLGRAEKTAIDHTPPTSSEKKPA